jgi:hypothetical protein
MEAAEHPDDNWSIARQRRRPGRPLERVLLHAQPREPDVRQLNARLARLEKQTAELQQSRITTEYEPAGHLLFLPTPDGYAIIEADEPPPPVGQMLILDHGCYQVQRVGRSPLPNDHRTCLYLERDDAVIERQPIAVDWSSAGSQ